MQIINITYHDKIRENYGSLGYLSTRFPFFALVIIFITKFLQSSPFQEIFFQIQAVFIIVMVLYFFREIIISFAGYNKEIILKYLLFLILFMFLYNPIRAKIVFGQPYYLGLLTMRSTFLIMASFWIYNNLINKNISFEKLKRYILLLAWISFSLFVFIYFFLDPQKFIDSSFVNYDPLRGYRYKFETILITLITFYYAIKYRSESKFKDLILLILLIAFALFIIRGRAHILVLLFVIFLSFLNNISGIKVLKLFSIILFSSLILFLINQILFPAFLSTFLVKLHQAFEVLVGDISEDVSANSRIIQTGIIFDHLSNNPSSIWFGVGNLSNHFGSGENTGFSRFFGYLYPTDTGIFGILFQYGIIGMILTYFIPVYFIIRLVKRNEKDNILIVSVKYFLIYILISSLYTGNIVFIPYFFYFLVSMLLAYRRMFFDSST